MAREGRGVVKLLFAAALLLAGAAQAGERIALGPWAASLPSRFAAHGVKTEPTYEEALDIARDGDSFTTTGGAPGWAQRLTESVDVSATGEVTRRPCAPGEDCRETEPPGGFLATAALIASARRGQLSGYGDLRAFGRWRVVCIDASKLGVAEPILDPCFEIGTGAAIAERHRLSGQFEGPTLTPASVRFD
jgi:hypothetical protein